MVCYDLDPGLQYSPDMVGLQQNIESLFPNMISNNLLLLIMSKDSLKRYSHTIWDKKYIFDIMVDYSWH